MTNRKPHHRILTGLLAAYLPIALVTSVGMVMCHESDGELVMESMAGHAENHADSSSSELPSLDHEEGPCSDVPIGVEVLAGADPLSPDSLPAVATVAADWSRSDAAGLAFIASRLARDDHAHPRIHVSIPTTVLLI